ncbi:MAG: hypothetical protein NXI24_08140 [bacterium]|nr:hypothetical protein [bacterium]
MKNARTHICTRRVAAILAACLWGFVCQAHCLQANPGNRFDSNRDPIGAYLLFQLTELIAPFGGFQALGVSFFPQPALAPGIFSNGQASVVSQGRIFVIGAGDGNQVYASHDGFLWILWAQNVFPDSRSHATALNFNGQMYLLGGFDSSGSVVPANQSVWVSADTFNWTNAAPGCATCPGAGFGFVFQSQLRFLDASGASVLSSPDGVNWTATATNAAMSPILVLVFEGAVFAFEEGGGVWTSTNALAWNRLSFDVSPPRSGSFRHGTVFDGRLWLFEDFDDASGVSVQNPPAAMNYTNLQNWKLVETGCCMRRHFSEPYSVEVLDNRMWLIGTRLDDGLRAESGVSLSVGGGTGVDGDGRTDFSL